MTRRLQQAIEGPTEGCTFAMAASHLRCQAGNKSRLEEALLPDFNRASEFVEASAGIRQARAKH